jgi:hypothetical protein
MKESTRKDLQRLADAVRDPFRLRLLLAAVTVGVMYFGIQQPLASQAADYRRKSRELQRKDAVAQQVTKLRKGLDELETRLLSSQHGAATTYLMNALREASVELQRIDGQTEFGIGPFQATRLRASVIGPAKQLDALLRQLEEGNSLVRIDTVSLVPPMRDEKHPTMQLSLVVLSKGGAS